MVTFPYYTRRSPSGFTLCNKEKAPRIAWNEEVDPSLTAGVSILHPLPSDPPFPFRTSYFSEGGTNKDSLS